jgi:hypothetical protein
MPVSAGSTTTTRATRPFEDPRDLRRVAADLKRNPTIRAQTPGGQLKRRRRGQDPPH